VGTPKVVGPQDCSPRDSFHIDSDRDCLPIVYRTWYEVRLNATHMLTHPQADVDGIIVFFFVELEPSIELDFIASDSDMARETHKLQLPN